MPGARIFITVAMMLIEPMMDDRPSTWILNMKKETDGPA